MSSAPQPSRQAAWKLKLFGRGQLVADDLVLPLERKTAALYGFLALEGASSRSRLAGLLWADSTEESARNSLRQRFYRLRISIGQDFIISTEPLKLDPSLAVDVVRFESLIFTGDFETALAFKGEFLEGLDFDDCPELSEWVLAARERLEAGKREALKSVSSRLEQTGDYAAALGYAKQILLLDPISEDAHRQLMRLYYLAGDRPAALGAFEQCQTMLETQLGVKPLPETLNLAKLIFQGDTLPQTTPFERLGIPIQILRPPVLVGRVHEWAQLEAAWATGTGMVVRGEAGVGKTRLIKDFCTSKGAFVMLEARPGDKSIGYATLSRCLKRMLEQHQNLKLEPWVRRELSRVVPNLEAEPPSAIGSDAEKIRFFAGVLELFKYLADCGVQAILADDLQFMDAASIELWQYIMTSEMALRLCSAYRRGELEKDLEDSLLQTQQVLIELLPLQTEGLNQLLSHLEIPDLGNLAVSLEQYTGGNPMYVLETIKNLLETGGVTRGLPEHFPAPQKIGALIRHRLERLSSGALRLAQVAAITETDFTLELAAKILEVGAFDLSVPLSELEKAQVLMGERFAHDLIFEATRESIPAPIQNLVHQKTAAYLEVHDGNPARIAQHWLDASNFDRAVPAMMKAAEAAQDMARDDEAIDLLERAIALSVVAQQRHYAQAQLGGFYVLKNRFEDAERLLNSLLEVVSDPESHWLTLDHLCYLNIRKSSLEKAREYGEQALELATLHGVASHLEDTRYKLGVIAHYMGEDQRAVELILPVIKSWRELPVHVGFLNALGALGQCLRELDRTNEALPYEAEMLRHLTTLGADHLIVNHYSNILYRDFLRGDASQAILNAENILSEFEQRTPKVNMCSLRNNLAAIYSRLERPDDAIRQYTIITLDADLEFHLSAWANLALLHAKKMQLETARHALLCALELAPTVDAPNQRFALIRAVYTLGSPEQCAQVQHYLDAFNFDALPVLYRTELEELINAGKRA